MPDEPESSEDFLAGELRRSAISKRGAVPPKLEPIDARAIFNASYPDPVFVIRDLLLRGVTILAGRPKVGKSWLALQLSIAVAVDQKRVLGKLEVARPGRVLYCGLEESPARTKHRLQKFISHDTPLLENLRMVYRLKPLLAGGAAELDAELTFNPAQLLVIDTLLAVVQPSGKRDVMRTDYQEIRTLTELVEKHKVAILLVHHLRKVAASAYPLDAVAGTTGVTAPADSVWVLTREAKGNHKLTVQGRDMENREYELAFKTDDESFGWQVLAEGAECGMSQERRDILTVLGREGAQQPAAIARLLGNKNEVTVRRLLQGLVHDGLIRKQSNATYVPCK